MKFINIPIEALRAFVVIADCGSYAKAVKLLKVPQPTISGQIRKLEKILQEKIFDRGTNGVTMTSKGRLLLPLAQNILLSNDQIVANCSGGSQELSTRIGISDILARSIIRDASREKLAGAYIRCDTPDEIMRALAGAHLDVACIFGPSAGSASIVETWEEELVWVRSSAFVLSPGKPVPMVYWPSLPQDSTALDALSLGGVAYRIVVESQDFQTRWRAVAGGMGIMVLPVRAVREPLQIAREYYLPALPRLKAAICVRRGLKLEAVNEVVEFLKQSVAKTDRA